ncbi:MAG: hypothetical protein JSU66_16085 [Deltaproteobacteria bacterium]|nr:MAG: hypothetical protein JSU66_16085 [Deltaproteobacteria bacterium]
MGAREPQRSRVVLYGLLVAVNAALFLLLEAGARLYVSAQVGPRALLYGTGWHRSQQPADETPPPPAAGPESARFHRYTVGAYRQGVPDKSGSYAKYHPNEIKTLRDHETGETFPVRINSQGFRGDDFAREKAPGVVRVLTLGASSTFGYGSRDRETYPALLEEILNERSAGAPRFEVINFGVPHAISDNLVAMFVAEGIPLAPDVVTLYAGVNDSAIVEEDPGWLGRLWNGLRGRLLIAEFADHLIRPFRDASEHLWSEAYAEHRSRVFIDNVETLFAACQERGIRFIVATQQAKSVMVPPAQMKGFSYAEEADLVRRSLADPTLRRAPQAPGERLTPAVIRASRRRSFWIHNRLMRDLRSWAARRDVTLVDVIEILDADRDLLLSWVHLHPDANRRVADAFATRILERPVDPVRTARPPPAQGS